MFKEIRKKYLILSEDKIKKALETTEFGVLGTIGENGYPYTVPVNFVYIDSSIYFHCGILGNKIDNINFNNKVSFTIVPHSKVLREKFDSEYESVIAFGDASEVFSDEKRNILLEILNKYSKDYIASGKIYIEKAIDAVKVFKIDIKHLSGKSYIEK
ncbi:MAG: pyridoxamine 5'-phosphate oxidase family protein [Sarcina sp.]